MKKLVFIATLMAISCNMAAQDYKQLYEERKELNKLAQKARMEKVGKDAVKAAKKLEKKGWMPMSGKLPLAKQLERSYNRQVELSNNGGNEYFFGASNSTAQTMAAAQTAAAAAAREIISESMGTSVTTHINDRKQQNQLSAIEAYTIDEMIRKGQLVSTHDFGMTETVVEAYRVLPNNNFEVMVAIVYSKTEAVKQMNKIISDEFERKGLQTASLNDKLAWPQWR